MPPISSGPNGPVPVIIGSVFFGNLTFPTDRRPTSADVAHAFATSASSALLVSAAFAVVAFLLVFTLPKQVGRRGGGAPEAAKQPEAVPSH